MSKILKPIINTYCMWTFQGNDFVLESFQWLAYCNLLEHINSITHMNSAHEFNNSCILIGKNIHSSDLKT